MGDLLEVQGFYESEKLIFGIIDGIVDKTVGEQHRVVCHLDLSDGFADADLELLLSLNSVADAATELIKTGRIDEEEVAFKCLTVDLNGTFCVNFDDWDLS